MKNGFAPLALALGLALGAAAGPAGARTMSIAVDHGDLDLTSPHGQSALDKRIHAAAREICGANEQRTGTRIVMDSKLRACIAEVTAKTARQVAAAMRERQLGG